MELEGCTDVADKVRYRFTWIMMHLCPRMISANVTGRYAMATLATTPTVERMNPPAITPAEPPTLMVLGGASLVRDVRPPGPYTPGACIKTGMFGIFWYDGLVCLH